MKETAVFFVGQDAPFRLHLQAPAVGRGAEQRWVPTTAPLRPGWASKLLNAEPCWGDGGGSGLDSSPGLPGLVHRAGGPCRGRWRSGSPGPRAAAVDRAGQALLAAGTVAGSQRVRTPAASQRSGPRVPLLTPPPAASPLPTLSTNHVPAKCHIKRGVLPTLNVKLDSQRFDLP